MAKYAVERTHGYGSPDKIMGQALLDLAQQLETALTRLDEISRGMTKDYRGIPNVHAYARDALAELNPAKSLENEA